MLTVIGRFLRRHPRDLVLGLLLALALPLGACSSLSTMLAQPKETAQRCTAWETPRAYVGCLAEDLTQLARDYEADSRAGRMSKEAFLAAEPAVLAARAALKDAGALLNTADTTRKLAAATDTSGGNGGSKLAALTTAAGGIESVAIGRAAVAEDQIKWLRENLARLRAPPAALTAPAVAPTALQPAPAG